MKSRKYKINFSNIIILQQYLVIIHPIPITLYLFQSQSFACHLNDAFISPLQLVIANELVPAISHMVAHRFRVAVANLNGIWPTLQIPEDHFRLASKSNWCYKAHWNCTGWNIVKKVILLMNLKCSLRVSPCNSFWEFN